MRLPSNVAQVAKLISDTSRAAILTALLDGRFHPASDLAFIAGIKPQTASFHLNKMVEAQIISVEKHGRHRYYGIHDQRVAQTLESLLTIAPPVEIRSFRQSTEDQAIRLARTCYDHIAGSLGVQIADSLVHLGVLRVDDEAFMVTPKGEKFLANFQIDVGDLKQKRRAFSPKCLDWSERRHHVAGALGNALLNRLLELNWVQRLPQTRAVKITPAGKAGLKEVFSIDQ